jgi:hypothetical protein
MLALVNQVARPNSEQIAIRCSFVNLTLHTSRSTPAMNDHCSPALAASSSEINPSFSSRIRIVHRSGFLGSAIGASTSPLSSFSG